MYSPLQPECVHDFVRKISEAILAFSVTAAEETFCTFSLFEDHANGAFAAGFDTVDNSLLHAKRNEKYIKSLIIEQMQNAEARSFFDAIAQNTKDLRIDYYNNSFSEQRYPCIYNEYIAEWIDNPEVTIGTVLILSLNIMQRLVESEAFSRLKISSPFRLCFSTIERRDMIVLQLLNWPPHQGPRV